MGRELSRLELFGYKRYCLCATLLFEKVSPLCVAAEVCRQAVVQCCFGYWSAVVLSPRFWKDWRGHCRNQIRSCHDASQCGQANVENLERPVCIVVLLR